MPQAGIPLGDILADSGYAHRDASAWAIPLRGAGAQLVQDLHPLDRGPRGTHEGAIIANGNLYCPAAPRTLLELGPLARDATPDQAAAHDLQTAETARYKLGRVTSDDADGYHRVACPAVMGKIRCPLRPASMTLTRDRPEILTPPEYPPACCAQQTITVPPEVNAKTAQKHDYPSKSHRRSYARRTGAERTFSTAKDPATNNIAHGWTRLMGLTPITLWLTCLLTVRNQRILTAWDARQADDARRAAAACPRKPGAGAARPSPASPPQHRHNPGATHPAAVTGTPQITQTTARRTQPAARNSHGGQATSPEPGSSREHARRAPKCQTQNVKISAGQT